MKRHVHRGHIKWIASAMRSCYHIITEKMICAVLDVLLNALTQCCKLISFLYLIATNNKDNRKTTQQYATE